MKEGYIKIGDEPITRLEDLGMYISNSDKIFCAPRTDYEEQYYPETGKSNIFPETMIKPFDYKVTIGVTVDINGRITYLNEKSRGKLVEIYNLYAKTKIVGYLKTIPNASNFNRFINGEIATFDIVIRVNDPSLCDFDLNL